MSNRLLKNRYVLLLCIIFLCRGIIFANTSSTYWTKATATKNIPGAGKVYVSLSSTDKGKEGSNSNGQKGDGKGYRTDRYYFKAESDDGTKSANDGYEFDGWYNAGEKVSSSSTTYADVETNENTTSEAKAATISREARWTAKNYTVTLRPNTGSGSNQTVSATFDAVMPLVTTAAGTPAISVPTKTGYSFGGYYDTSASSGGKQYYSYSNSTLASATTWDKTSNTDLFARWTAITYTITLNNQSATSAGSTSVAATYDANTNLSGTPAITKPTKTGYTFGGYYTGTSGAGVQIINADGNFIASAGGGSTYTDGSKNWKYANSIELYAKWTVNDYIITLDNKGADDGYEGTGELAVTFDANTNLVDAIDKPSRAGYTFEGYYTAMSGGGVKVIDKDGNVIENAGGSNTYTDASNNWKYDGNITLYAYWKQNQSITWTQDLNGNNYVRSTEITLGATAPGGTVTYTATSNAGTVQIVNTNKLTCLTAGSVTVTAHQSGNHDWNEAPDVSKTFTIIEHAITTNPTASGITYEQTLASSSLSGGVTNVGGGSWRWDDNSIRPNYGTTNQVAVFTPSSSPAFGASDTLHCLVPVTVAKATPDVTCTIGDEYDVDDAAINLETEWTREGDGARSYSIVSFTPLNDKNNGAAGDPIIEGNRLYLRKAGTLVIRMDIAEGTNYNARTGLTKTITINKRENTISINGTANSYSTEMYMESTLAGGITLSATNTDYSGSAFVVTAGAGAAVGSSDGEINALYTSLSATTGKIESNHNTGDATWTIYQPENYKYEEASATLNVNVKLVDEATNCYVYSNNTTEYNIYASGGLFSYNIDGESTRGYRGDGDPWFTLTGPGGKLYFNAKHGGGTFDSDKLKVLYSTDNKTTMKLLKEFTVTGSYVNYNCSIPDGTTDVCFFVEYGQTGNRYYRDIYVTRKTYLNAEDVTIDRTSTSNPIYPSDGTGVGTLTIDYSLASGGDLHIYNDNPEKFTLSQTTISDVDCKTGTATINLSYQSAEAGTDYAHLVIYNDVYRKEVTLTGITVQREQTMSWNVGDAIHLGDEVENAADATITPISYSSDDTDVINIVDGKLVAVAEGTATITARSEGNVEYAPKEISKTITVTSDLVQEIVWNQPALRRLRIGGSNVTLEASATSSVGGCSTNGARPITYTSANTSVVEIVNTNQIRIVGAGRTYVTASQAGGLDADGHRYMAVSLEKEVIVNDPNAPCTMTYLYQQRLGVDSTGNDGGPYRKVTDKNKSYATGTLDDEPGYVILEYKTQSGGKANMYIEQLLPNGWSIAKNVGTPSEGVWTHDSITLDRRATNVRVRIGDEGKAYHYYRNMKVSLARYIETSELSTFEAKVGQSVSQDLTISYNNLARNASLTLGSNNSKFAISEDVIEGTCGDKDNVVIRVTYTPTEATDGEEETLTISDGTTTTRVTLRGEASLTERYISWGQESPVDVYSAESITLNAQALVVSTNAPAGSVYYSLGGESTTGTIDGTTLTFARAGVAYVAAQGMADARYNTPVAVTKQFNVQITPTEVITAPTIANAEAGTALGSLVIDASSAVVNNTITDAVVAGTFSVQSGEIGSVGTHTVTLLFTPTESEKYTTCTCEVDVEILPKAITFNNGSGDSKWETVANWSVAGVDENSAVTIAGNLVIDEEVAVYSLVISEEGTVTIDPEGGLTVGAGGIAGATAEKLILKAGTEGVTKGQTGYLRISPEYTGAMPQATVELYSIGYYDRVNDGENIAAWQYVGSPLAADNVLAKSVYTNSWIYSWDESSNSWKNNRKTLQFKPFMGYATTQYVSTSGIKLTYNGQLVSSIGTQEIELAYSGDGHGDNMVANSFAAPIDITKMVSSDFVNADPTIYIFHTGTRKQAEASIETEGSEAGQFKSIAIGTISEMAERFAGDASLPTTIAPMQGFNVSATSTGAKLILDYERLVWNGDYTNHRPQAMRSPKRAAESEEHPITGSVKITLNANGWADNIYILESERYKETYEAGYDARKMESGNLNIFTITEEDKLAVDATNSIVGTRVGVRTGEETAYTMTFNYVNCEKDFMLWDTEADARVEVREGGMYTFFAEPNSEITGRFVIVEAEAPEIATGVEETASEDAKVHKFIKDDKLFILKNGVLYDATGMRVR